MLESESDSRIKVAVRIRPKNNAAERYDCKCVNKASDTVVSVQKIAKDEDATTSNKRDNQQREFKYDYIFDEGTSQCDVYSEAAEGLVQSVLEGHNATIFAYGQTGSGKTYSILGDVKEMEGGHCDLATNSGIFLRSMKDIFDHKANVKDIQYITVTLSVIEIYVDDVNDLLKNKVKLKLRDTGDDMLIPDLTRIEVSNMDDVYKYFKIANSLRAVTAHKLNDVSSRSHAVFFVDIVQQMRTPSNPNPPPIEYVLSIAAGTPMDPASVGITVPLTASRFTITDLAGSERIKESGVTGAGITEAKSINLSLFTLKRVVKIMYEGGRIPYRDSNLTRILKQSFISLSSKVLVVANVSPTNISFEQTLGTLRFADEVKNLRAVDVPSVNAEAEAKYLRSLRQCEELAAELRVAETIHGFSCVSIDKLLSTDMTTLVEEERRRAQEAESKRVGDDTMEIEKTIDAQTRDYRESVKMESTRLENEILVLEKQNEAAEKSVKSLTSGVSNELMEKVLKDLEILRIERRELHAKSKALEKDMTRLRGLAGVGPIKSTTWEKECEEWVAEATFHSKSQLFQQKVIHTRRLQLLYFKLRCRLRPAEQDDDEIDSDVSDISIDDDFAVNPVKAAENAEVLEQERLVVYYENIEKVSEAVTGFLEGGCVVRQSGSLKKLSYRDSNLLWIKEDNGVTDTTVCCSVKDISGVVIQEARNTFTIMVGGKAAATVECLTLADFEACMIRLTALRQTKPTFATIALGNDDAALARRIGLPASELHKIIKHLSTLRQEFDVMKEHMNPPPPINVTKGSLRVMLDPFHLDNFRCAEIHAYLEENNMLW